MKLMIVDDHDISLLFSQHVLSTIFDQVETILQPSGYSALDFLNANAHDKSKIPDLILLDLDMPVINGQEFLIHLREFKAKFNFEIKVFILSGHDKKTELKAFIDSGEISKYLKKPLTIRSIRQEDFV